MTRFCVPRSWTLEQRLAYGSGPVDPNTGCMPWMRARDKDGYGKVSKPGGSSLRANRVALELKLGRELCELEQARHTCDNTNCVNPDHLTIGSDQDNSDDMTLRRRSVGAGLKDASMPLVLEMHRSGSKNFEIAGRIGIASTTVCRWLVEAGFRKNRRRAVTPKNAHAQKAAIKMFAAGCRKVDIATALDVPAAKVYRWTKRGTAT